MSTSLVWRAVTHTSTASSFLQILLFLPLTLATISKPAFLLLSFLLSVHAAIHGTLNLIWGSTALEVMQLPMHPILLLFVFNVFSSSLDPGILSATGLWETVLKLFGPLFIILEGMSSLIVAQKIGQEGKRLVEEGELYQFGFLISSAIAYVGFAWWIVAAYPLAATSPLSSTLLGVALTALLFLTFIGFALRRTNIIESSSVALFIAYNIWLCGVDQTEPLNITSSYVPLLPNLVPHLQALSNFVTNTLPKPVIIALLYRLTILHLCSRILPTIGSDSWESENGESGGWEDRPSSNVARIVLTYRQLLYVTCYSQLLLLDHSSLTWWRWINIFVTLVIWAVELLVSNEDDVVSEKWKVD
ncbi:hypothetical protein K435DRAFT_911733 [Dendrothele bispora CBS 962.96]|uniref:ICE2-domain-containing protein n=1 Tax=Dendrothele bispora (strain CBS 962.96) TaxID=1314807 RepID=A0A4S8MYX1_DENBC|nr:hypothetical protein K435DRAFT_911733 [Dendrothele bispora CBS 962.96]